MSIRVKLFLAFSILLSLAVGVAAFGIRAVSDAGDLVVRLYDQPFMAVSHARAAQAGFNAARAAMERALLLRDVAPQAGGGAFEALMNEVLEELKVVKERSVRPGRSETIAVTERLAQSWYRTALQIIKPPADGLTELPLPMNVMRDAGAVATAIDQIVEDASAYGFEFRSQAETTVADSRTRLTILALATGIIGILLSFGIAHSFVHPIHNAMAISERIAAGNLSEKIATHRRDELGRLLVSLGRMQEALRYQADSQRTAAEIKDRDHSTQLARRERVEGEIAEFRSSIGKMLKQAEEMTERMNTTARTLSTISTEADKRAKEAAAAAEQSSINVGTVASSTEELDASVHAIRAQLESATKVVTGATEMANDTNTMIVGLADSAERIENIIGLIRSIAEQTNLLALNATIEAARAGDAGRGFAVVASEVKALATQTAKATEDISGQISGVQLSTSQAVERIRSITSVMTEISAVTMEIAGAVQQQGTATGEISRNIQSAASATQNVARNVTGTTTSIGETNRATADVLEVAEYMKSHASDLRTSVDQFLQKVGAA
jgi:methyl-accepting chemotaxis protein